MNLTMTKLTVTLIMSAAIAGCATNDPYSPNGPYGSNQNNPQNGTYNNNTQASTSTNTAMGGSQATSRAVVGAGLGAAAGNVIGYITNSDRTTATVLGALIGGGVGYWQGRQEDARLRDAQLISQDIARMQAQSSYQYEQPRIYARAIDQNNQQVATFDRFETPIPNDAIRNHSSDATQILQKLGSLAARNDSEVQIYGPTPEARDYMLNEIRRGSGSANLRITSTYSQNAKVVVNAVPVA